MEILNLENIIRLMPLYKIQIIDIVVTIQCSSIVLNCGLISIINLKIKPFCEQNIFLDIVFTLTLTI